MKRNRTINDMSRAEIEAVPIRGWGENIGQFDSLVILPTRRIHDSGYRRMDFVACRVGKPLKRLAGGSDVIHLGGIGGYGLRSRSLPQTVPPIGWSVDCLSKSGLLQIFAAGHALVAGDALSSFELWAVARER